MTEKTVCGPVRRETMNRSHMAIDEMVNYVLMDK